MAACMTRLDICVLFRPFLIRCEEKLIRLLSGEVQSNVICIIRSSGLALLGRLGFLHLCHTKIG